MKQEILPKTVIIDNRLWNIEYHNDHPNGLFVVDKELISIGTLWGNKFAQEVLIHEVLEAIMYTMRLRYECGGNIGDYIFSFGHKDFIGLNTALVCAIRSMNIRFIKDGNKEKR